MLSPAQINIIKSSTSMIAGAAYSSTPTHIQEIATTVPMGEASQLVLYWTGMLPKPRLWTGPRVVHEAAPQSYVLVPKLFEETLGIDQFELSDTGGTGGLYWRNVPDLGRQLKRQPDYWNRDLIEASGDYSSTADQAGFDGLSYWNTAPPVDLYRAGAGTYSNDFTTISGSAPTVTMAGQTISVGGRFGLTALATIREYMGTLKAEDGEPMNIVPDLLMYPTMLQMEVDTILTAAYFSPPSFGTFTGQVGAVDNPGKRFGLRGIKNELLQDPTKYYVLDTTKAIKPFLHVVREATQMVSRLSPTDPIVFDEHKFLWGGWGRIAMGWGYSWLAARGGFGT